VQDTITYDIFKEDSPASPLWLEAVGGLEQAMNRMEEIAMGDPSSDYFLFCTQADKVVRRLRRRSVRLDDMPSTSSPKTSRP
jgi:hypothetical protein